MNRRNFLKRGVLGAGGLSIATGIYTYQIEPFWLEYVKVKMPITNLPESLIGKTLMQISDIHVGDRFDYQFIIDSFQDAQQLKPDFVVYTGDYVSYVNKKQIGQLNTVLEHTVKGKLGTVGILGNHDYGHQWRQPEVAETISSQLSDHGITVLRNQQVNIQGLNIIGMDDLWALHFKPELALSAYNSAQANLVLVHNPDACDLNGWDDYQGWILSGHTHGGQCKPPFLVPPRLPVRNKKYSAGEIDLEDGRTLYINRALGHLWQVRFNVRPEITLFDLERA